KRAARLSFSEPLHGKTVMRLPLDLENVVALAYNPHSGNLYTAALASGDSTRGGIYRLDDNGSPGKPLVAAVKVADIDEPTSMAFGPDGTLYITSLGSHPA